MGEIDDAIDAPATIPPRLECQDCGKTTRERTVGVPVGSCPERDAVYATHRYEVVGE